jgi:hypothetical protein
MKWLNRVMTLIGSGAMVLTLGDTAFVTPDRFGQGVTPIAGASVNSDSDTSTGIQAIYRVVNRNTGRCMDESWAYGLRAMGCNGLTFQYFSFDATSVAGTYYIRSSETGRCVDDSLAYGLRTYACNGLDFQRWFMYSYDGATILQNLKTGRCIDDSYAYGLRAFDCNQLSYQHWFRG